MSPLNRALFFHRQIGGRRNVERFTNCSRTINARARDESVFNSPRPLRIPLATETRVAVATRSPSPHQKKKKTVAFLRALIVVSFVPTVRSKYRPIKKKRTVWPIGRCKRLGEIRFRNGYVSQLVRTVRVRGSRFRRLTAVSRITGPENIVYVTTF